MYEDKLQNRYEVNRRALENALNTFRLMLDDSVASSFSDKTFAAVDALLTFFKVDKTALQSATADVKVTAILRMSGLFFHRITLSGKWWRDASGPILAKDAAGDYVAVFPTAVGYKRFCPETGRYVKVNSRTSSDLQPDALNFFVSLPKSKLSIREFLKYVAGTIPGRDYAVVFICCVLATLLSLLVPVANKIIFSEVVPSGIIGSILPICMLLLGSGISAVLFTLVRNLMVVRMRDKINANVQPALFSRMLTLPSSFFRKRSSSDISARVLAANNIYQLLSNQMMSVLTAGVFAILYVTIAFLYASSMVMLVTVLVLAYLIICVVLFRGFSREYTEKIPNGVVAQEFTYGALSGIHKIKNNRAEIRAYSQWVERYSKSEEITIRTSLLLRIGKVMGGVVFSTGNLAAWIIAWRANMAVSDYLAFMSAFGVMQTALYTTSSQIQEIAKTVPYIRLIKPLLDVEPEGQSGKPVVTNISGSIDINHVTFRYSDEAPKILDDVSLHISAGENVGLVGASGCGKSTLMRIMLGFEKPNVGSVFFGQNNLENVNIGSLRQYIGYCPQMTQIFPDTIAANIRLASVGCTDEEVWEAARIAALDEDIRRMPMQMETRLGEGGSGLSGGQCQRLLIARAVINKPKVMFFDEATSALDNITQRKVVENLNAMGCTRISIAHRLSTVMNCDRIIVLDKGRVVEDGSPKELMEQKGFFYKLSIRQQ